MLRSSLLLCAALCGCWPAAGQGLITKKAMSIEMAETIAHTAIAQCRTMNFHVSVSVIDASGLLKAFLRDEPTGPHTIELSRKKAFTALTFANRWDSSGEAAKAWHSTLGSPMPNVEGTVGVAGGVPIKAGDEVIGAVGVSGAVGGANDEICAKAGIAKVAAELKP